MQPIRLTALGAMVILCAGSGALAEDAAPKTTPPVRVGPFDVKAKADVTGRYVDNVFATENHQIADFVTSFSPEITLSRDAEDYKLEFGASAELGRFATETSENYNDVLLRGEGQWNLSKSTYLFGGADYAWKHESRTSPDEAAGAAEPTTYREASGFAGVATELGAATARIGVNLRRLNFDDTALVGGGEINNDDRDRLHTEVGGRVGWKLSDTGQVFAQGVYDRRNYRTLDYVGIETPPYDRDSQGFNAALGYAGTMGPFRGEVLAGVIHQAYDDSRYASVTTPDAGAELTWQADPLTRIGFRLDRRLEETTIEGASGYVSTSAIVSANRWIARDLRINGHLGYIQEDFNGIGRKDNISEAGFGLQYYIGPRVYVGAGYSFQHRTSNAPGADYDIHAAYLRLGAKLNPEYSGDTGLATLGRSGFYIGAQAGDGLLKTSVEGQRGNNGSLLAEFGDLGSSGGLFAGYRAEFGRMVLGLEVDGGVISQDWHHDANRTFSVEAENSLGLSAILGTRLRNNVLLYGRAGVIGTEFKTTYTQGMEAAAARTHRDWGMRFGAGAEVPVGPNLSARMEYGLAAYPDIHLGAKKDAVPDNFSSVASLATFGLVYHFGAEDRAEVKPVDFGGLYVGGQIGHGGLVSENRGPRNDSESENAPEKKFTLDAQRAGFGATGGLYAGYGATFGNFYLGGEVEAELANVNWDIDRDPNGRFYSVEKKGSVGAALRAGYVFGDSVLVYGRAGLVNSWFDTKYEFDGGRVSPTEHKTGVRFGGGVEFALTDRTRMRLDYTRTSYGKYRVDYGDGVDSFDTSENLFRVGISYAF